MAPGHAVATTAALAFGLLVGARHAFEPDHLAAVSTLVTTSRGTRNATMLGLVWGVGHTIALLAVGIALAILDGVLPAQLSAAFELAVAAMLVLLGARAVIRGVRNLDGQTDVHSHRGLRHAHPGAGEHVHVGRRAFAWRPLTIGLVHGLAGSGALTALTFAELPTTSARILYMVLFGAGSVAGMAFATGIVGAALQRVARGEGPRRALAITSGIASCVTGVVWALPFVG